MLTGMQEKRRKQLLDDLKETRGELEIERGSTRSTSVDNSLWNRQWNCREAEYGLNETRLVAS